MLMHSSTHTHRVPASFATCSQTCAGRFDLFSYRVSRITNLPLYVTPNVSFVERAPPAFAALASEGASPSASGGESGGVVGHLQITVGARPTEGKPVEEVSLRIPLPPSTVATSLSATVGTVSYDTRTSEVSWQIGRIPKEKLPILSGTVTLGLGRAASELSISMFVAFKVVRYSCSGLKVASMRVENEEYQPYKGVRSITQAGRFEVRC